MNPRPNTSPLSPAISRRTVLGVTVAGASGLLVACGGSSSPSSASSDTSSDPPSDSPSDSPSKTPSGPAGLVAKSQVPVGEGVILTGPKIVVTQPTAGNFKAFTAVCTHMACTVGTIANGTITCPCHGSTYSIKDGSVTGGPAPKPLAEIAIKVKGDEIVKA
jgi:Rieske Fe-S protein